MITELHRRNGDIIYYNEETNVKFVWDKKIQFNLAEHKFTPVSHKAVEQKPHSLKSFLKFLDK